MMKKSYGDPSSISDFLNVAISSYMSTWKNNEWACLPWSSLHAAYDQKGRPFIVENV